MITITKASLKGLIQEAIERINNGVSKTLTARNSSEKPPQDTRHLTDTRTRVSTLLEYSLSYELNNILLEKKLEHTISNVLWNVFPDLVIRDSRFNNKYGLEIKALHSAAEEKSANLHTPLSLIRKEKDFIVILVWGWIREQTENTDITYPHIHDVGIFDAWLIAKMRDTTWLINSGDRVKGIDISTPIISSPNGGYKAEEGNLGKLMRIHLSSASSPALPYFPEMNSEAVEYDNFKKSIIYLGLLETSKDINNEINGVWNKILRVAEAPTSATVFASSSLEKFKLHFIAGTKRANADWNDIVPSINTSDVIIQLGNKLDWKIFKYDEGWKEVLNGKKPDIELDNISCAIVS